MPTPTPYDRLLGRAIGQAVLLDLLLAAIVWTIVPRPWNTVDNLTTAGGLLVWVVFLTFITGVMTAPIAAVTALVIARRLYQARSSLDHRGAMVIGIDTALHGLLFLLFFRLCGAPGSSPSWNGQMNPLAFVLPVLLYGIHAGWLPMRWVCFGVLMLQAGLAIADFGTNAANWNSYLFEVVGPSVAYVLGAWWLAGHLYPFLASIDAAADDTQAHA